MTVTDYRARLDTEPLTDRQLGALHGEFRRLGFRPAGRAVRLWVTAELARSDPIGSTKDLTMGEAGRALGALRSCRTAADLYVLTGPMSAPEPEPEPEPDPEPWPLTLLSALVALDALRKANRVADPPGA